MKISTYELCNTLLDLIEPLPDGTVHINEQYGKFIRRVLDIRDANVPQSVIAAARKKRKEEREANAKANPNPNPNRQPSKRYTGPTMKQIETELRRATRGDAP